MPDNDSMITETSRS